uniref:BREX system Lon protease-like protein BrxL n=1 Tax=Fervidicoccus fontis TaxID=683846 RepID=A0A7J3ZK12_9CREN
MSSLDEKVRRVFGAAAVDKELARLEVVSRLPRFIAEYLISRYYSSSIDWIEKLSKVVEEYYPDARDRERVLSRAKREGRITLIDEYNVVVDLKKNMYFLHIPNLQIYDALVEHYIVEQYERILSGLWGVGVLEYCPELAQAVLSRGRDELPFTPLVMVEFEPFQVYNIDVTTFIEGRMAFSTSEWIDLLIKSVGLNPLVYSERQKLLLLVRFVPLIEGNVNLMELGPRATGKTYLYRNASYYTRIYAGGTVSAARLFYDARLRVLGDVGTRDVVVFDEIAKVRFSNPDEVAAKLKDYMVDGFFERGQLKRAHSDCSLVFTGNIELGPQGVLGSVVEYLPSFMKDSAFIDRIHGLLPGWELPKILKSDVHLAHGYALAADYLSEVLHRMRAQSFEALVEQHVELVGEYTIRDERAVKKLLSGLVKLVFPHKEFDSSELRKLAAIAVELRQNVVGVLSELSPHEFPRKTLSVRVVG